RPVLVLRDDTWQVAEHRIDAAGGEVVHGRPCAAIGHVGQFNARLTFEQFATQMGRSTNAARGERDLATIVPEFDVLADVTKCVSEQRAAEKAYSRRFTRSSTRAPAASSPSGLSHCMQKTVSFEEGNECDVVSARTNARGHPVRSNHQGSDEGGPCRPHRRARAASAAR